MSPWKVLVLDDEKDIAIEFDVADLDKQLPFHPRRRYGLRLTVGEAEMFAQEIAVAAFQLRVRLVAKRLYGGRLPP